MAGRTRLLLGLLWLSSATSFQIQDDCRVIDSIEVNDVMFDTLEFLSLVDEKSAVAKAVLTCRESDSGILLNISRDKISWRRTGFQDKEVSLDESAEGFGWKRFKLGFANKTVTLECDGKPYLGKGLGLGCAVGKVSIKSGRFTGKCSPGTPAWLLPSASPVDIPLAVSGNHIREDFILFSPEPFNPSFKMKGAEVELGLRGDSLVTSGEMEPLPAEAHEVALQIVSDGSSAKLKMTKDGEVVLETALEDSPKCVQVSGNKRFVLVQKLRQDSPRKDASSPNTAQCPEAETEHIIPLLTSLAISTLLFFALLVHHCRLRHTLRTGQQGVEATTQDTPAVRGTSSIPSGTPTPQQSLSPVTPPPHHPPPPPSPPPWPPAPPPALSPMASASSEAWYYEMYPTATVAPPPNSYALLDAKTEETINDMYESVDEL